MTLHEHTSDEGGEFPFHVCHQKITVPLEYPVYFTRRLFDPRNGLLESVLGRLNEPRRHRAAVYLDSGLASAQPTLAEQVKEYFHVRQQALELTLPPQIVPGGEAAKNSWNIVREIMWTAGNVHLDRHSCVVAIGGGSVLDMVGFAASLVHRGVRVVRVPTTTLAQNDAGVGVKTSMNEHGQKNFAGTFAAPFAVINDSTLLTTLSDRDWLGGVSEAYKVAIIKDADFLGFLCDHAKAIRQRQMPPMETLIRRCAELHLQHIREGGDPFETGSARPLDFGHWSAHKLETMSSYTIGHGQAVAIGIAMDSYYAMHHGLITQEALEKILRGLSQSGLAIYSDLLEHRTGEGELEILEGLELFREHLGGVLTITLPDGLGKKTDVHHMDIAVIEQGVAYLKQAARAIGV